MAAAWDILGKAANLAQFSGLQVITTIAVTLTWLQFPHNHKQFLKLQGSVHLLRQWLQLPTVIQHLEINQLISKAIQDADALVELYKESTVWSRVCKGRSMAIQLRDMRNVVDSYCHLIIVINASLLIMQPHPSHPDVRIQVNDHGPGAVLSACESSMGTDPDIRSNDIDQEGT